MSREGTGAQLSDHHERSWTGHEAGESDLLIAILHTPHRFRTQRQPWICSGFGIETHSSADHCSVGGQLRRSKTPPSIRGLNQNHNHDLKNLFKGAGIIASSKPGPFREFYTLMLAKGMRPEMARLTLARKIAAVGAEKQNCRALAEK